MGKKLELAGRQFERLVVVQSEGLDRSGKTLWFCRCICGKETVVIGAHLVSGRIRSCGCLRNEKTKERFLKHGHSTNNTTSSTYNIWRAMLKRCENPGTQYYERYGGRGISVCARWKSFEAFLSDMGERPSDGSTLDRIDNDGNYEPGNCQWRSREAQSNNTCRNVRAKAFGEEKTVSEWSKDRRCNVCYQTLHKRITELNWDPEVAVTKPHRGRQKGLAV